MATQTEDPPKQNTSENKVISELKFVPKDTGWAWMCVLSGFLMNVLVVGGAAKSFGILFVEFVERFKSSSAATSWISSLSQCLALTLGPVASTLAGYFGTRPVVLMGGLLIGAGFVVSIFANSTEFLYFSYGCLVGIGSALAYTPSIVLIGLYFEKRRSLANGLTVAGSGVGNFVFPPLMRLMLDHYGLGGALLVMAGLMLNICVCGALLRPLSSYVPKNLPQETKDLEANGKAGKKKGSKFDWSLLKVPPFLLFGFSLFFCFCGYPNIFIMLPPHCKNIGMSKREAAMLVSVIGILDVVGRVFFGWFSDLNLISKRYIFCWSMAIAGVALVVVPFVDSFVGLAILCGIIGVFAGSFVALIAPILAETLGTYRLPSAFGLAMFFQGLAFLFAPPLVGFLEDHTNNWMFSFVFSGASLLIGAVLPLLFPLFSKQNTQHVEDVDLGIAADC